MLAQTTIAAAPRSLVARIARYRTQINRRIRAAALRRAIARAYRIFARQHPDWVGALFDERFLNHQGAEVLQRYLEPGARPSAAELARSWNNQAGIEWVAPGRSAEIIEAAGAFLVLLDAELAAPRATGALPQTPPLPPASGHSPEFAEALREASNLESDWFWLAARMERADERRYCLERALYINPQNEVARRLLCR